MVWTHTGGTNTVTLTTPFYLDLLNQLNTDVGLAQATGMTVMRIKGLLTAVPNGSQPASGQVYAACNVMDKNAGPGADVSKDLGTNAGQRQHWMGKWYWDFPLAAAFTAGLTMQVERWIDVKAKRAVRDIDDSLMLCFAAAGAADNFRVHYEVDVLVALP